MANLTSWETIMQLKDRVAVIKYELARTNRFIKDPFVNKSLSPDKRKAMYEKAVKKRAELENELVEKTRMIAAIMEANRKIANEAARKQRARKKK